MEVILTVFIRYLIKSIPQVTSPQPTSAQGPSVTLVLPLQYYNSLILNIVRESYKSSGSMPSDLACLADIQVEHNGKSDHIRSGLH